MGGCHEILQSSGDRATVRSTLSHAQPAHSWGKEKMKFENLVCIVLADILLHGRKVVFDSISSLA
jgi:hypothetical protein